MKNYRIINFSKFILNKLEYSGFEKVDIISNDLFNLKYNYELIKDYSNYYILFYNKSYLIIGITHLGQLIISTSYVDNNNIKLKAEIINNEFVLNILYYIEYLILFFKLNQKYFIKEINKINNL